MALEDLYDTIIAHAVTVVRANSIMPALVDRNVAGDLSVQGGQVNVDITDPSTTSPVVPGPVPKGGERRGGRQVPVSLDFWEDSSFSLTDRDISSMSSNSAYIPRRLQESAIAVADRVDETILANYRGVYGFAGVAGITPFATTLAEAQDAIRVLADQKCPMRGLQKQIVLDTFGYTNALGLDVLQDASKSGSVVTLREGRIEEALNFGWHMDQNIPRHSTGAAGTPLVNGAGQTGNVLVVDGLTAKPAEGDVFTVAGNSQTYVVLAATDLAGSQSVLSIAPAIAQAPADNAALTFKASHAVNLAFHPSAFAFASRVAAGIQLGDRGPVVRTWVDAVEDGGSGLVLTLRISPEHYQTSFYLSCMWGSRLIDARLATRIAG